MIHIGPIVKLVFLSLCLCACSAVNGDPPVAQGKVRVIVLHEDGHRVSGARVESRGVFADHGMEYGQDTAGPGFFSTRTDMDGTALVYYEPENNSYIICRHGNYSAASFAPRDKPLELVLSPDRTLWITLTDKSGHPLVDERVRLVSLASFAIAPSAKTNESGRASLRIDATQPNAVTDTGQIKVAIGKHAHQYVVGPFAEGAKWHAVLALDPASKLREAP